jgi:hypothetical protein
MPISMLSISAGRSTTARIFPAIAIGDSIPRSVKKITMNTPVFIASPDGLSC